MSSDRNQVLSNHVHSLVDQAIPIGVRVEQLSRDPEMVDDMSYLTLSRETEGLEKQINLFGDVEVSYSGIGFTLRPDKHGDLYTVYTDLEPRVGRLSRFYLAHSASIEYIAPDDETEEEGDSSDFDFPLRSAPEGVNMYAEFIREYREDIDEQLRGVCVRTDRLWIYDIVNVISLNIHDVNDPSPPPLANQFTVAEALRTFSNAYRKRIQNKAFRNWSLKRQEEDTEAMLKLVNTIAQVDRFNVLFTGSEVFVPQISDQNDRFEHCTTVMDFVGKCLRVDCIEAQKVAIGYPIRRRKGNLNSRVSSCLVVEIDDDTAKMLGVAANIVWLPLLNQTDYMMFLEPPVL